MTKKETMQIMLQDVVDQFVVNPKSRGLKGNSCKYDPENFEISPGCAIGMYLNTETAKKLDTIGSIEYIFRNNKSYLLPNWMINLGKEFLKRVQNFHDYPDNFTQTGISIYGLEDLKDLCTEYKLELPKINKINMP